MKLISISEIENVKSVSSPHTEELKKFGKNWVGRFRDFDEEGLRNISQVIGGELDDLGIGEEWALTKEFFPEVRTHLSYHYHGEEFSSYGEEDMVRFMFSGDRVRNVTGEDLAGMIDVMLSLIGRSLSGESGGGEVSDVEISEKYYTSRVDAIKHLDTADGEGVGELADFLGCQYEIENSNHILNKEFFPGIEIRIEIEGDNVRAFRSGEMAKYLSGYELDLLAVYTMNHIIRFVAVKNPSGDLPEICSKVFPQ